MPATTNDYSMPFIRILLVFLVPLSAHSQNYRNVQGSIRDSARHSLTGAVVSLVSASDTMSVTVDTAAGFYFRNVKSPDFALMVSFVGYEPFTRLYRLPAGDRNIRIDPIILIPEQSQLEGVIIRSTVAIKVKEDTIEYSAKAFKVREGDAVEEIVKKLPGMEVDNNGNMTIQGEPITRVKLNGKDFFGADAAAAIQNLPADIVKNLQVIDDYGDKAAVTGVKGATSEKILNINLEPDKENGYYGKATAGIGTADRYLGRVRTNVLQGDRQIAIDGSIDNTESGDGIAVKKSVKLNFHDTWGSSLESYGSYNYTNRQYNILASAYSQSFFKDYTRVEDEQRDGKSGQEQHLFSWNLEYRVDSNNYFKVKPNISFNNNHSQNTGVTKTYLLNSSSVRNNLSRGNSSSSDLGTELLYNHKFRKPGRNLDLEAKINFADGDSYSDTKNNYIITDSLGNSTDEQQFQLAATNNKVTQTEVQTSYMEPLSASSFAVFDYRWSRSATENVRDLSDVNPDNGEEKPNAGQSNDYNYQFITHRLGLHYQFRREKMKYMLGVTAQPSLLKGIDISRGNATSRQMFNLIPVARFTYRLSGKQTLTARYNGRSQMPGFVQLQPVTNNSDLQNTVTGNPDLKPEFSNNFFVEYKKAGSSSGATMLANLSFNQTQNKIVTTRVIVTDSLKEKTSYINTNGFYTVKGFYTASKPFANRRYTLTYSCDASLSNNIAFTNNERNEAKDLDIRNGLKLRLDLPDIVDVELNTAYSFNKTMYSSAAFTGRQIHRIYFRVGGRNYFSKRLTLGYDFSQTINKGYNTGNPNPTLLNMYVECRFLKGNKGALRLAGFDLLAQNTGVSRDVFDNKIVDQQNNRLSRYLMLSFHYRLQDFGRK